MPEIGEIARIVHYLKKHAVGKTISKVQVQEDDIVYGKVGTSAAAFQKAMAGKKIVGARQQGKYFWLEMSSPPHPLMHFGMTGWMKFSNDDSSYYKPAKEEEQQWPPRFWKFVLELAEDSKAEVAFIDARRLARIRLVDAKASEMRNTTPLKENGPDPVIDKDILTVEWLTKKLGSKRVPVKALLLDQANISGVGNWVGDEVLYQARIHPEQYSNTLNKAQIQSLHDSLIDVCTTAVTTLADSDQFPETWLMKHRWGKGKKDGDRLPNGDKIIFLKVGGRTSAVVPSVQKKTGPVAGDVENGEDEESDEAETKPKAKKAASKSKPKTEEGNESPKAAKAKSKANGKDTTKASTATPKSKLPKRERASSIKSEDENEDGAGEVKSKAQSSKKQKTAPKAPAKPANTRTSARLRGGQ